MGQSLRSGRLNGEHERPLFAFPGIWRAFMTTEPNALTRAINHERMPVRLHRGVGRHVYKDVKG
jgi:hypothetical protein